MLFFYTLSGDYMKVYIDLVLFLNFGFDFILLLSVSLLLRRNIPIFKLIIGAFIGSLSVLLLFIKINSLQLFLYKIFISIIMLLITFGFKNLKYTLYNLGYLYLSSIVLGGGLYFINNQFSYKQKGIIFFNNGFSINLIILILFGPLIIYIYIKQLKKLKNDYQQYYKVDVYFKNNKIKLNAYLDSGNNLCDPYKNRPVIFISKKKIPNKYNNHHILVPYKTVNNNGLLKCIKADKIYIYGIGNRTNFLIGIMEEDFEFDGVDCIIQRKILEG